MMEFEIDSRVQPIGKRHRTHRARNLPFGGRREKRPCQPKQHRVRRSQIGYERGSRRTRLVPPHRSLQNDGHPGGSHRGGRPQDPENHLHAQTEDARCRQCGGVEH